MMRLTAAVWAVGLAGVLTLMGGPAGAAGDIPQEETNKQIVLDLYEKPKGL